jgi:hypothetical protein
MRRLTRVALRAVKFDVWRSRRDYGGFLASLGMTTTLTTTVVEEQLSFEE